MKKIIEWLRKLFTVKQVNTWERLPATKRKVCIVGFAETTRDLAPWDDPEYEIWGLNEENNFPFMKRWDRWFQVHPRWDFSRLGNLNDPNHLLWLQQKSGTCRACNGDTTNPCEHCTGGTYTPKTSPKIVYMQKEHDDIPNSVKIPLDTINHWFDYPGRPHQDEPYFTSSLSYMLGMAILLGFEEILLVGFEMGNQTEYHYQRANAEYMIGFARGRGINVVVPDTSALLKGELYGYTNMKIGYRQNLEIRRTVLLAQESQQRDITNRLSGQVVATQELAAQVRGTPEEAKVMDDLRAKVEKYTNASSLLSFLRGTIKEVELMMRLYDEYYIIDLLPNDADRVEASYGVQEKYVKSNYVKETDNGTKAED